ncbi:fimbrial protein [Pseudomonas sp. JM0905a]|uniref:fimbrial protein n=1 Tax=Pseudomonas sp. JM0905a TaxID=2772484 RepID=UPI0016873DB9|nr:fimbrial protein [Pseudomonas sp. JM0905a]MBD2837016.1 fimbrial protein [Pseudomonas sp. JM0905a]
MVECWVDINGQPADRAYLYANPRNINLGSNIEAGITYQGKDYLFSSLEGGRLNLLWESVGGCPEGDTCGWKKERNTLTYSIFFAKKSHPTENQEGTLTVQPSWRAFQIEGRKGVRPDKSYNLTLSDLRRFKYLPCASTVSISPSTIDFGPIGTTGAKAGATIEEAPFTITEERSCDAVYGVSGNLQPLNATLSSDAKILIPTDNDSVGITILDAGDQTVIPFKREFVLSPKSSFRSNSREFLARLTWMDDKPKLGRFNAGATLNIYYR